jgi:hypothetical protein
MSRHQNLIRIAVAFGANVETAIYSVNPRACEYEFGELATTDLSPKRRRLRAKLGFTF